MILNLLSMKPFTVVQHTKIIQLYRVHHRPIVFCLPFCVNRILSLVNNITKVHSSVLTIPQDLSSVSEYYHC